MKTALLRNLAAASGNGFQAFPERGNAEFFLAALFRWLFTPPGPDWEDRHDTLVRALSGLLRESGYTTDQAEAHQSVFFGELPRIYRSLLADAAAMLEADPAAQSLTEVIQVYPGFYATAVYRLSHQLWQQGVTPLPRLLTEIAHSQTGIDIHPAADIGESFSIDHGTGIVIGATAVIGKRVRLYQGVTLGALHVTKALAETKRHPTLEDDITVYAGATILGGATVVGRDSIIGGNVWLTRSVPAGSVVYHESKVIVRDKAPLPDALHFII